MVDRAARFGMDARELRSEVPLTAFPQPLIYIEQQWDQQKRIAGVAGSIGRQDQRDNNRNESDDDEQNLFDNIGCGLGYFIEVEFENLAHPIRMPIQRRKNQLDSGESRTEDQHQPARVGMPHHRTENAIRAADLHRGPGQRGKPYVKKEFQRIDVEKHHK